MKHALIRLREELRDLHAQAAEAGRGGPDERSLLAQLKKEISETREGIAVLEAASLEVREVRRRYPLEATGRLVSRDWDRATFEPWADRKERREGERRARA